MSSKPSAKQAMFPLKSTKDLQAMPHAQVAKYLGELASRSLQENMGSYLKEEEKKPA